MRMKLRYVVPVVAALAVPAAAQSPRAPRETVTATINGKKVAVEYGKPALAGRTVKDLLAKLPDNRVWRAGVDQATTLTTETDLMIGGKKVPAGKYTLYVHAPTTGSYELLVNSDLGVPLKTIFPAAPAEVADALWPHIGDYPTIQSKEVARIPLKSVTPGSPAERLAIALAPVTAGASAITLTWGDQSWTADIKGGAGAK
jgi:CTP:molybdopterin cytidylyltransferase MocA